MYNIHLKAAQEWGNTWYIILDSIYESINQELERKYKTVEEKNKKNLVHTQTKNLNYKGNFYPHVINETDITFTNNELTLLNKGLKYNLNHKHKNCIKIIALEVETAITQLPIFGHDYTCYQVAHNIKHLYKQDQCTHNTVHLKQSSCIKS